MPSATSAYSGHVPAIVVDRSGVSYTRTIAGTLEGLSHWQENHYYLRFGAEAIALERNRCEFFFYISTLAIDRRAFGDYFWLNY